MKEFKTNKVIIEELHQWQKIDENASENVFKMYLISRKSSSSSTSTNARTKKELRKILRDWGY